MEIPTKQKTRKSLADKEFLNQLFLARRKRDTKIIATTLIWAAVWLMSYLSFPVQPKVDVITPQFENITVFLDPSTSNISDFIKKVNVQINFILSFTNYNFFDIKIYSVSSTVIYSNITIGTIQQDFPVTLPYSETVNSTYETNLFVYGQDAVTLSMLLSENMVTGIIKVDFMIEADVQAFPGCPSIHLTFHMTEMFQPIKMIEKYEETTR
jgi:hypothetical protein